jgi:hypothetical protein
LGIATTGGRPLSDVRSVVITAWTNENSASRVPLTGNTMVAGSTFTPKRRAIHAAQAARVSGRPAVTG